VTEKSKTRNGIPRTYLKPNRKKPNLSPKLQGGETEKKTAREGARAVERLGRPRSVSRAKLIRGKEPLKPM